MSMALDTADADAASVGFISAHGTATGAGDIAESHATSDVFGSGTPFASLKGFFGHTLGACGAIEAWLSLEMMREGWFAPNHNLSTVDPECADLAYLTGNGARLETDLIMSNNFAFGGINTSLVFRRL